MFNYQNITAAAPTTTVVKTGIGDFNGITINKATANAVIAIYDGIDATGTLIGTITLPATLLLSQDFIPYNVSFRKGLTIVTSTAACDLTISFR
jgi:hypothetical protein